MVERRTPHPGVRGALRIPLLAALLLALLAGEAAAKDVIRFKSGRELTGKIVEENPDEVTIELFTGGRLTVPRSLIAEIRRDVDGEKPTPGVEAGVLRAEHSFLWSGERRLGSRVLYVRRLEDGGLLLEEDSIFTDEEGKEDARIRHVEKVTASFEPREITYRETSKGGVFLLHGNVRGDQLILQASFPGNRRRSTLKIPEGMKLPLSAREYAVRGRKELRGDVEIPVFDPREESFSRFRFEAPSSRRVDWEGSAVEVTVVRRLRSGRGAEEIWLDPKGRCLTEELNGSAVVAILSTKERVEAFREGGEVAASEEEERVRPLVLVPEAGFTVRKPAISWTVEKAKRGSRKVLSMASLRHFAYVDVFVFPGVPEGGLLSALAVDMEKRFSGASEGFRKLSDGFRELDRERAYQMVATSRNKGETLRSILVGALHEGKTWVIALACPEKYFTRARPEFEAILGSFRFLK